MKGFFKRFAFRSRLQHHGKAYGIIFFKEEVERIFGIYFVFGERSAVFTGRYTKQPLKSDVFCREINKKYHPSTWSGQRTSLLNPVGLILHTRRQSFFKSNKKLTIFDCVPFITDMWSETEHFNLITEKFEKIGSKDVLTALENHPKYMLAKSGRGQNMFYDDEIVFKACSRKYVFKHGLGWFAKIWPKKRYFYSVETYMALQTPDDLMPGRRVLSTVGNSPLYFYGDVIDYETVNKKINEHMEMFTGG